MSQSNADSLTFAASDCRNISRPWSDIKDDRPLHPWNEEVSAFTNHQVLYTSKSVEDHSSMATINWKLKILHINICLF